MNEIGVTRRSRNDECCLLTHLLTEQRIDFTDVTLVSEDVYQRSDCGNLDGPYDFETVMIDDEYDND